MAQKVFLLDFPVRVRLTQDGAKWLGILPNPEIMATIPMEVEIDPVSGKACKVNLKKEQSNICFVTSRVGPSTDTTPCVSCSLIDSTPNDSSMTSDDTGASDTTTDQLNETADTILLTDSDDTQSSQSLLSFKASQKH